MYSVICICVQRNFILSLFQFNYSRSRVGLPHKEMKVPQLKFNTHNKAYYTNTIEY